MTINIGAAGMSAPSIIQPLKPEGDGWHLLPPLSGRYTMGYAAQAWSHPQSGLIVISAVEVAADKDGIDRGPEYHISVSKDVNGKKVRCDSNEARWMLAQFGCDGAKEDNHVPGGFVRNFWRTVAENLVGMECACKEDEPAIREDKGDFIWRP